MEFDGDHVDRWGAAVTGVSDPISTDSETSAVWVRLFWAVIYTDAPVRDISAAINGYVVVSNEHNSVGTGAFTRDSLRQSSEFGGVGLAPEVFILRVDK